MSDPVHYYARDSANRRISCRNAAFLIGMPHFVIRIAALYNHTSVLCFSQVQVSIRRSFSLASYHVLGVLVCVAFS